MIVLMEKESVSSKIPIKSFTDSLSMDNWKVKANCIFLLEIIMLVSLSLIKSRAEVFIDGLAKSRMFIKVSLSLVREMEEEHFGGLMEVGMKETSKMVFNVALVLYIVRVVLANTRVFGRMVCLMVKVFNTLTMDNDMKDTSKRINSMERVYFTKMTQSFMECGKTMSCQWSTW